MAPDPGRLERVHPQDEDDSRDLPHDQKQCVRGGLGRRVGDLGGELEPDRPGAQKEKAEDETRNQKQGIAGRVGHAEEAGNQSPERQDQKWFPAPVFIGEQGRRRPPR